MLVHGRSTQQREESDNIQGTKLRQLASAWLLLCQEISLAMGGSITTITDLEKEKLKSEELTLHLTFPSKQNHT